MKKIWRVLLVSVAIAWSALAWSAEPVNINTADAPTLQTLYGIGPVKANAIIEYREKHGPFATVDDLNNVQGIGDKAMKNLREQITVSTP